MDFGYKIITPKEGIRLQISLLSDSPGYVLGHIGKLFLRIPQLPGFTIHVLVTKN